ncbi:unnamed protein product, partial [Dovyalis caffra]
MAQIKGFEWAVKSSIPIHEPHIIYKMPQPNNFLYSSRECNELNFDGGKCYACLFLSTPRDGTIAKQEDIAQ